MYLEKQLKKEFRKKAENIIPPMAVDQKVKSLYRQYHSGSEKKSMYHKFASRKGLSAAIIFVLLTGFGFASKTIYEMNSDQLKIEIVQDKDFGIHKTSSKKIRENLKKVKAQLKPGEAALVYLNDFENEHHPFLKDMPGLVVSKPVFTNDYQSAISLIDETISLYKKPKKSFGDYVFTKAFAGYPLDGGMDLEAVEKLEILRKQAIDKNETIALEKLSRYEPILPVVTLAYENDQGEEILLTIENSNQPQTKFKVTVGDKTSFEELEINKVKAAFLKNKDQFLSNTGEFQEIKWLKEEDGKTIVYSAASTSLKLAKLELASFAKNVMSE